MANINISATVSCDGTGGVITGSWSAANNQNATVTVYGTNTSFTDALDFTGVDSGAFTFNGLADDLYEVSVTGTIDGTSSLLEHNLSCGPLPVPCDLVITSVTTGQTSAGLNNGTASVNASGTGTIQYSLNGEDWQNSNVFTGLAVGAYTAYIQKQNQVSCNDQSAFQITAAAVFGCTNPEADNYNPAATADNGTCLYTNRFYPCGGVLPNPVFIGVNFPVLDGATAKANHYVKVNIYKAGETSPFATATQTLRNGKASVDISRYLRGQFNNAYQEPGLQAIFRDDTQSFGFYVGIIEHYNGTAQPEVLRQQPGKVAVNAALPEYTDTVEPYLIKGQQSVPENPNPEL